MAAAVVTLGIVGLGATPVGAAGCANVTPMGGWDHIAAPHFPAGPATVTSFSVSPFDADLIVATNGRVVMRSGDGGCTFQPTFDLRTKAKLTFPGAAARITDVEISPYFFPAGPVDGGIVFLAVAETGPAARPHILRSTAGGTHQSWQQEDSGLETAVGQPLDLAVETGSAGRLYLLVGPNSVSTEGGPGIETGSQLYSSSDATNWSPRAKFSGPLGIAPLTSGTLSLSGVTGDPNDASAAWVFGQSGLLRSNDDGDSFERVLKDPIGAADVASSWGGTPVVRALQANAPLMFTSTDDGGSFKQTILPDAGQSVAHAFFPGEFAIATLQGNVVYQNPGYAKDISPLDGRSIRDLRSSLGPNGSVFYGRSGAGLERWSAPALPQDNGTGEVINVGDLSKIRHLAHPHFIPRRARILIPPGGQRTVPFHMMLPGTRQVDIFFLIDVSGSMQEEINGVRSAMVSITNSLAHAGVDPWFGVGEYRSYSDGPAYQLDLDVSPITKKTPSRALDDLRANGGNEETQLEALYQLAKGTGRDEPGAFVTAGQQVNWRPGALHVVINATDENFGTSKPQPTFDVVRDALNSKLIKQVGLAFVGFTGNVSPTDPLPDPHKGLARVARDTHAVAPEEGVDCNGDGAPDIKQGEPLVCDISSSRSSEASVMAPAIVSIVNGLVDNGTVEITSTGRKGVVRKIACADSCVYTRTATLYPVVDFATAHDLPLQVTFACPQGSNGTVIPVMLHTLARSSEVATAPVDLVCGTPPKPPPLVIPAVALPLIVQPPEPPPPPQPNPQPNPQPQGQPQFGVVAQRQQQLQVAVAYSGGNEAPAAETAAASKGTDSYQMSALRDEGRSGPPPGFTWSAAALMSIAFVMVQRRSSPARTVTVSAGGGPRRRRRSPGVLPRR